jgi:hypothetical protein
MKALSHPESSVTCSLVSIDGIRAVNWHTEIVANISIREAPQMEQQTREKWPDKKLLALRKNRVDGPGCNDV